MNLYRLTQTTRTTTRPVATRPASAHEALVRSVGEAEGIDSDRKERVQRPDDGVDRDAAEGRRSAEAARDARELAKQLSQMGLQAQDLLKPACGSLRYRQLDIEA